MNNWKKVSIIVPIYNEAGNIMPLYDEIYREITKDFSDSDFEVIFVNDWSKDDSWKEICQIQEKNSNIIAINLHRNYGQATALQVWFENCSW